MLVVYKWEGIGFGKNMIDRMGNCGEYGDSKILDSLCCKVDFINAKGKG